jgi:phosphoribosyl 1,2-cyclic phosphate phosphodiesterase
MPPVELLFLGTGTSAGVPMIGCHCPVCDSADPRDRRTRPSVVISQGDVRVLVDASPELRLQCVANRVDAIDAVALTHAHADHIMGMDDLRRFNAIKNGPLDVWGDEPTHAAVGRCFGYAFAEPDPASKLFRPRLVRRIIDGPFQIGPMRWRPIRLLHGSMPILGFRVGRVAYCTDVNQIPAESYELLQGLDVLVLDALTHRTHATHFSLEQAVAEAAKIDAGRTFFTHVAHGLAHAGTCQRLPAGMSLAYDGLRVSGSGED